jgi:hypothetical protein
MLGFAKVVVAEGTFGRFVGRSLISNKGCSLKPF